MLALVLGTVTQTPLAHCLCCEQGLSAATASCSPKPCSLPALAHAWHAMLTPALTHHQVLFPVKETEPQTSGPLVESHCSEPLVEPGLVEHQSPSVVQFTTLMVLENFFYATKPFRAKECGTGESNNSPEVQVENNKDKRLRSLLGCTQFPR